MCGVCVELSVECECVEHGICECMEYGVWNMSKWVQILCLYNCSTAIQIAHHDVILQGQ